ncbi:unnamed protein product [Owenia fusiformis]|uniref:Hedgehog protein n=1 Tax=Owenia fusiformis TaxID=6347 RepID=A0A8S4N2Z6_OWEFU|nr:unnamed protein product [Owenia fusiformis]
MATNYWKTMELFLLIFLCLNHSTLQCGPGRGPGRPRGSYKLIPLVFKQHVPNVSENTLGASGLPEGKISRNSPKFKDLITNHNTDIIFKDEENTGADKMMSERCKDKLDTLAISVMNHWPGVKLRVTEAWDEDGVHAKDSLHYEGRSVDITTSDRDRSKYGMLARLAVEAGFDWVYYQSRGHIHCSVKSDSSIAIKSGGCFPGTSLLTTKDGSTKTMSDLRPGDNVLTVTSSGELVYSPVISFLDRDKSQPNLYYTLHTESAKSITLTPSHLIYVSQNNNTKTVNPIEDGVAKFAMDVREGQYIYITDNGKLKLERVIHMEQSSRKGGYAPITAHGTIVVDGALASCYAVVNSHNVAHYALTPLRLYHYITEWLHWSHSHTSTLETGVHWYAKLLYDISPWVMNSNMMFNP